MRMAFYSGQILMPNVMHQYHHPGIALLMTEIDEIPQENDIAPCPL
jgi:hypothetical protein